MVPARRVMSGEQLHNQPGADCHGRDSFERDGPPTYNLNAMQGRLTEMETNVIRTRSTLGLQTESCEPLTKVLARA